MKPLSVAFVAITLAACAQGPAPRSPRGAAVSVAPPARPPPAARERVEAALAKREGVGSRRVELTTTLDALAPEAQPVALAAGPTPGVITIPSDLVPTRTLGMEEMNVRPFESAAFAHFVLARCFGSAARSETVRLDLDLSNRPAATHPEPHPSVSAICVRQHVTERMGPVETARRARLVVRLVVEGDDGSEPPSLASLVDDITEIGAQLGARRLASNDTSRPFEGRGPRARDLTLLLGARYLEIARRAPDRRKASAAAARSAFERVLASADGDDWSRAAALRGLSSLLDIDGQLDVAARMARALVCPSRFGLGASDALEQDHPEAYWRAWERMHEQPIGQTPAAAKRSQVVAAPDGPKTWDEEIVYRSPYADCAPPAASIPAPWIADAWRLIADHHSFEREAGPFRDNRTVTALRFALASSRGPASAFVALELGRALFRQQRYAEVARVLARFAEPEIVASVDRETLDRAAQLAATSLTYFDVEGPPESEPYVQRSDVLDTVFAPAALAKKLSVVAPRLERADLVPQDDRFAPLVARWAAWELTSIEAFETAMTVERRYLVRFPKHVDAPLVAWQHARTAHRMASRFREGTPEQVEAAKVAAEAEARLADYVGETPWTEAHRGDAAVLRRAALIVKQKLDGP